jgi:hypothetical protein
MQLILASSTIRNNGEEARDRRAHLERETGFERLEGSGYSQPAATRSLRLLPPQLGNVTDAAKLLWFSSYGRKQGSLRAVKANPVLSVASPEVGNFVSWSARSSPLGNEAFNSACVTRWVEIRDRACFHSTTIGQKAKNSRGTR